MLPRRRFSALTFAAPLIALLFVGAGCSALWDEVVLGEDPNYRESSNRAYLENLDKARAKEMEAKRVAQEKKDALRPTPSQTYLDLAKKTPDEIRALEQPIRIPVLALDGEVFPFPDDQFRKAQPDECKEVHYHAAAGFTLTRKKVTQPDSHCGFGSTVTVATVDTEELILWLQLGPKAKSVK